MYAMRISPHENLTITLIRRNNYGDLRFQGSGTVSQQVSLADRLRVAPPCLRPHAWYWQETYTLGTLVDVVA